MNRKWTPRLAVCAAGLGCVMGLGASSALAKEPDPAAVMAAYEKAGTPGEQHKQLQRMVGKWDITMKSWMDPKAPPMESRGTAEVKPMLGDRFVEMKVNATMMDKPFTGVGITGYDNTKKKFVGSWIDSMSTGIMRSEGTADATGKIINTSAVSSDPLTGKESKMRMVEKWESDDRFVEEFYEKRGGKETKTMEITYVKAGAAPAAAAPATGAPPPAAVPAPGTAPKKTP